MANAKTPNPVDRHVGARVRMRRMMLSLSQESLGNSLGLTFQQVQKYEKGANRIGASRMQHIANILQVPVAFFFDGAPASLVGDRPVAGAKPAIQDFVSDFLATSDGVAIARAFAAIPSARVRRSIVTLAEEIAESQVARRSVA